MYQKKPKISQQQQHMEITDNFLCTRSHQHTNRTLVIGTQDQSDIVCCDLSRQYALRQFVVCAQDQPKQMFNF